MIMSSPSQLRSLLSNPEILVVPGAADALTARLVEEAGFEAVYATGAGIANLHFALPDIGLLTMTEMVEQIRRISQAVTIPVIADADTGYGNPLNVMRTVQAYEAAGVAAIQIEDQVAPKRCGHFSGKEVIPAEEMVEKLRAALVARKDPDFVVIARTDSLATHGVEEAVRRANLYAQSGADLIFIEAPTSLEVIRSLPQRVSAPLLFNMTEGARTPLVSHADLQSFGYQIVIHPNLNLRIAMKATQQALSRLKAEGTSANLVSEMLAWEERQRIVRLEVYEALDRSFSVRTSQSGGGEADQTNANPVA